MIRWKPAVLTGLGSWLIPFAISFVVFPLRAVNPPLFESIMTLVVLGAAGALFPVHFRGRPVSAGEAVGVGALWVAINLMLDYPLFAFGPMRISAAEYYSRIGLGYLAYPLFGACAARLARPSARPAAMPSSSVPGAIAQRA